MPHSKSKHPIVQVDDVEFAYGEQTVLEQVSFAIEQGEFLGIIGPNGGGKTTLLRLILGLIAPKRGQISVFANDPTTHMPQVGYVPQGGTPPAAFPLLLKDMVLMGRLHRSKWGMFHSREDLEAARAAMDKVSLLRFADTPFHQLSGGLARRGLIARALCAGFPLLLLDEPTANVDAASQVSIADLLQKLKGQITIAMVSHDMPATVKCADRILYVEERAHLMSPDQICGHYAMGLYHRPTAARL